MLQENETVVFSWIIWPSKSIREIGMPAVMEEFQKSEGDNPMPFDGSRIIFGSFNMILNM